MVYSISGSTVTLCGHGSGTPSLKNMKTYCKSRYNSKTSTKLGNKGLIRVRRFIQDDDAGIGTTNSASTSSGNAVTIAGSSVNIRKGAGTSYDVFKLAKRGDSFERLITDGWTCIKYKEQCRWISSKYVNSNGICTGSSVNIRGGAGTSFASVGGIRKGDVLEVVNTNGWIPIVINGTVYWVSSKYAG